jgi:glutathione peroxidase
MKKNLLIIALLFFFTGAVAQQETFHDFSALTIVDHDTLDLSTYAGKKVLVVNTASYCGFTNELGDLAILDSLYGGPHFAIIGFPCNDFGAQEPFDDSTIKAFYQNAFHVRFQLMSKIAITSPDTAEVYKWLQLESRNGVADANVTWNFNKFCIDEAGHWIRHLSQTVYPLDTTIVNWILSANTTGVVPADHQAEVTLRENPSHGIINIGIKTAAAENLTVTLYDLRGSQIQNLFSGRIEKNKDISFIPENLASGIYFLKVQSATTNRTMKVSYIN